MTSFRCQTNDHEKKTMLCNAFPHTFNKKFQESAKIIEGSTIDEIVNYFQILYDFEKYKAHLAYVQPTKEKEKTMSINIVVQIVRGSMAEIEIVIDATQEKELINTMRRVIVDTMKTRD
jgi:hypothetical protein